jgi:hypothetical protein
VNMSRKPKAPPPSRADRAAEQADYKTWFADVVAELQREHTPVYPGAHDRQPTVRCMRPPPLCRRHRAAMIDESPFKVVRSNGTDEVLAGAMNLLIARGAYREAARMHPEDLIELRQGAGVIENSK